MKELLDRAKLVSRVVGDMSIDLFLGCPAPTSTPQAIGHWCWFTACHIEGVLAKLSRKRDELMALASDCRRAAQACDACGAPAGCNPECETCTEMPQ